MACDGQSPGVHESYCPSAFWHLVPRAGELAGIGQHFHWMSVPRVACRDALDECLKGRYGYLDLTQTHVLIELHFEVTQQACHI